MKKITATIAMIAIASASIYGGIKFTYPAKYKGRDIKISTTAIKNLAEAKNRMEMRTLNTQIRLSGDTTEYLWNGTEPSRISFRADIPNPYEAFRGVLYVSPGEDILIECTDSGFVNISGTPLMDSISALNLPLSAIENEARLIQTGEAQGELEPLKQKYDSIITDYIKSHPKEPATLHALLQLDGEDFSELFNNLDPSLKSSVLYPLVLKQNERVQSSLEKEKLQKELESSHSDAPEFSLPDLEGKPISLKDFRGKWVILDFWGSWCGWCIKGFPELKNAYNEYAGKLEIIGIDCGDTDQQWRDAVKKFELPWVNVYNAQSDTSVDKQYGIQGFPTKIIINPEGKIYKIVTGEDPAFYEELAKVLK